MFDRSEPWVGQLTMLAIGAMLRNNIPQTSSYGSCQFCVLACVCLYQLSLAFDGWCFQLVDKLAQTLCCCIIGQKIMDCSHSSFLLVYTRSMTIAMELCTAMTHVSTRYGKAGGLGPMGPHILWEWISVWIPCKIVWWPSIILPRGSVVRLFNNKAQRYIWKYPTNK